VPAPVQRIRGEALSARLLGGTGVAGIAYLVVTFVFLHFVQWRLHPGEHFISEYVHGQFGWLVTVAFFVGGIGTLALALGLHRSLESGERVATSIALITSAGVSFIALGIFKIDPLLEDGTTGYTPTGIAHLVATLVLFVSLIIGALTLRSVFAGDPRWRGLEPAALRLTLAMLVAPIVMFAVPQQAVGLAQRALVVVLLSWLAVIGWWMRRLDPVARPERAPSVSHAPVMSTFNYGSRALPILSEAGEEPGAFGSRSGVRVRRRAARRPWLSIGQQLIEGIPALKITRH